MSSLLLFFTYIFYSFHITVGFKKADIHDVKKDLSTLVPYEVVTVPKEVE